MHEHRLTTDGRIERFLRDVLGPQRIAERIPLAVTASVVDGEPIPFAEAVARPFAPFAVGSEWGRAWDTVWFRVTGEVPAEWSGADGRHEVELEVDLGYSSRLPGFQAEGIVYDASGRMLKGLEPLNRFVPLPHAGAVDLLIEAAANPNIADDFSFRATPLGHRDTAGDALLYVLRRVDLVRRDVRVTELWHDATALWDLVGQLPDEQPRRRRIVEALARVVDLVDPDDVAADVDRAREVLAVELGRPAHASAHRVHAVGHAHIDSAWLWPTRETVRKFARTLSNVLDLIDRDPDFRFVASSAQQYAWVQQHYPELFERLRTAVDSGRIIPVGGMWVESDATMIGGESMIRQFLLGSRFFREAFGVESDIVWLPDSFGFSAALPQIFLGVGATGFVTQKISWNDTNRMPHHTFSWEGIDGSRILTHFPPVDSYMSDLGAADLAKAERQYAEKAVGSSSIVPFGWGDGGGGPTREMIALGRRKGDLEGSPRVEFSTPAAFFDEARQEIARPPVWSGELYLELHRGVFTSQAETKQGNRRSEALLHEAELWAATAAVRSGAPYPHEELDAAWRIVLLQQFHDILPGTSISWVHEEAEERYAQVRRSLESLIDASVAALAGEGDRELRAISSPCDPAAFAIVESDLGTRSDALGRAVGRADDGGFVLESDTLRVVIDRGGRIVSFVDLTSGRELIVAGEPANRFQLFRDRPAQWDAWDLDENYRRTGREVDDVVSCEIEGEAVVLLLTAGASTIEQRISLSPDGAALDLDVHVDWREDRMILKLALPVGILADRASSETQFGHVHRPTHANTSWDAARFETVAHRWVQVEEPGQGLVVANASAYGWDIQRLDRDGRGVGTLLRASLLRAATFPDPDADRGEHDFALSLRPTRSISDAVAEGYRRSRPPRALRGATPVAPLVRLEGGSAVIETVKLADDRSGDLIVRIYEASGASTTTAVVVDARRGEAQCVDLLERERGDRRDAFAPDEEIVLLLRPFEIVTLRIRLDASAV
ncbi:glycoside hydrolase family 38 C-terminal domain-containing protein [Yonghaparkia sp. Root332]|uniref:alpha-mannosidase n=1 Tax=Yonghaparkia sp. Root332 TaxID=1736516 RepID=UPI0006FA439D|nr:glycoside hydrolase family 38 C-terminal domain-containing protein [Yonghaparkia sp. Root332]KQV26446.1 alpha-mannosidase [Yonghaparkia sp. Root332]